MQSKPKIILLSAGTENYLDILHYTLSLNMKWIKQNAVDWQLVGRNLCINSMRPASWFKLPLMCLYMEGNYKYEYDADYVIWIDADCFIKPDTQLADLLPADRETFRMLSDANGCNCGVIAMPSEPWAVDFLDRWWLDALPEEITHPWWENKTAIRMMGMQAYRDRFGAAIPVEKVVHASGIAIKDKLAWLSERYGKLGAKDE